MGGGGQAAVADAKAEGATAATSASASAPAPTPAPAPIRGGKTAGEKAGPTSLFSELCGGSWSRALSTLMMTMMTIMVQPCLIELTLIFGTTSQSSRGMASRWRSSRGMASRWRSSKWWSSPRYATKEMAYAKVD